MPVIHSVDSKDTSIHIWELYSYGKCDSFIAVFIFNYPVLSLSKRVSSQERVPAVLEGSIAGWKCCLGYVKDVERGLFRRQSLLLGLIYGAEGVSLAA